jgi:Zn-dependent M28 family amino/carboxypeptidase
MAARQLPERAGSSGPRFRLMALTTVLFASGAVAGRQALDVSLLMRDLQVLSADDMEGRLVGTPGSARAREYIVRRFREAGIQPIGKSYERPFVFKAVRDAPDQAAVNIVGAVRGRQRTGPWMVVTAHYDHLGVRRGEVFNGADDNASGVAALLAVADSFRGTPPVHSILFAALDAEESGLRGARELLRDPPIPRPAIALNVNLDMVARDEANTLYASGTYHYPFLKRYLQDVSSPPVILRFGHDIPKSREDDWTRESDHFVFHQAGIPFVYFGVEDEAHHHKSTDDAETVTEEFFVGAARTIAAAVRRFDANLNDIQLKR